MWWRNPWLQNRKRLLGLAVVDALLMISAYKFLYQRRFRHLPGITHSVVSLVTLWLGSSYLLGRYSRLEEGQRDSRRRRLLLTLLVAALALGIVVVILSWGLKVGDPRTFRRFLLPLLTSVSLGSILSQLWLYRQQAKQRSFLLIGQSELLKVLQQELEQDVILRSLNLNYLATDQRLDHAEMSPDFENTSQAPSKTPVDVDIHLRLLDSLIQNHKLDGIAISETAHLDDNVLQQLLSLRSGGTLITSLVHWAEQHLQRVPPELFSSRWLVQA